MKKGFFDSFKTQIILFIILIITLSTGIVAAVIIYFNYGSTLNQMKIDGLSLAKSNAINIMERAKQNNSKSAVQDMVVEIAESQNLEYCTLLDEGGIGVFDSQLECIGEDCSDESTEHVIQGKKEVAGFWTDDDGKKVLDIMIPFNMTVENEKIAILNLGISIDDLQKTILSSIYRNILISLLSIIFFSIVISLFVDKKILKPITRISKVADEISRGDINVAFDLNCKGELGSLTHSFVEITDRIKAQALAMEMISNGNFDIEISSNSPNDIFSAGLITMKNTIDGTLYEMEALIYEILNGNLKARGNQENYNGKWQTFISEINRLIEAMAVPINLTATYVEKISQGDIPPKITDDYMGDFNEIKNNLNGYIDIMNSLLTEMTKLTEAVREGKLDFRGDSEKFSGNWSILIGGINNLVDSFTKPINLTAEYIKLIGRGEIPLAITDTYYGDFNEIKNSINSCIDGLGGLVEGGTVLKHMSRNDCSKKVEGAYLGIYAEMANSINAVRDRIVRTVEVLNNIASGDLGDLEALKSIGRRSEQDRLLPSLILLIENIQSILNEAAMLTSAVIDGKLDTKSDTALFEGAWKNFVSGMNNILDEVAKPLTDVTKVMNEIANANLNVEVEGSYKGDFDILAQAANATSKRLRAFIRAITDILSNIADGNIALDHIKEYRGDFVKISSSLNVIIDSLNSVIGDINEAAEQVSSGAKQVSDGSQTLSQGSTEQASAIVELTASISEVAGQTKLNAINANKANELAANARNNAIQGNDQMRNMLRSMEDINESSENISKIIKVINDIAFQTNILALNAAVEAARAGQYGKGFAVVAEEVRSLAARSADAAKETTSLIEGSIGKVQAGTKIAGETANALTEIVSSIEAAANLIEDIAEASNEQASGIAQINKGIEQVSAVIQNNSATAEESAATSEELSSQSEYLKLAVSKFKLRRSDGPRLLETVGSEWSDTRVQIAHTDAEYSEY